MRPILAAIVLFSFEVLAQPPQPVVAPPNLPAAATAATPAPDKSEFLDKIRLAAEDQRERRKRTEKCCWGHSEFCDFSKSARASFKKTKEGIEKGAAAAGAQGTAVAAGDFADSVRETGAGWVAACADMGSACKESGVTLEDSLKAQCPDCTTEDFALLHSETAYCPTAGITTQQVHVTELDKKKREEFRQRMIEQFPGRTFPGGPPPINGGGDKNPGPVVVDNDNRDWRDSLGRHDRNRDGDGRPDRDGDRGRDRDSDKDRDGDHDRENAKGRYRRDRDHDGDIDRDDDKIARRKGKGKGLSAFAESLAKLSGEKGDFKSASVGTQSTGTSTPAVVTTAPSEPEAPIGLFPSVGSVGMREVSARALSRSRAMAARQAMQPAAVKPAAMMQNAILPRLPGTASFQPAGGAAPLKATGSGAQPVTLAKGGSGSSQFSHPDLAPQSMGGFVSSANANAPRSNNANLRSHLPSGLSPQSRSLAGSSAPANPQILSQGKDVWENMSMRMQHFCKIGRLYDCN